MQDANTSESAEKRAVKKAEKALEKGFAEVKTPSQAAEVFDKIESAVGDIQEEDVTPEAGSPNPLEQAAALKQAADTAPPEDRAAAVLTEGAVQIAAAPPENREALDQAVEKASGEPSRSTPEKSPQVEQGQSLLRKELIKRLQPFDAIDAVLFVHINHLPHPKLPDRLIARFSWIMTGGHAWILVILIQALRKKTHGIQTLLAVLPPLYLATSTVEIPIKKYFRRRRPFISIVRAIVVGRKPGSYSFPSGHSAAAFAGAILLQEHYPAGRRFFFFIAVLVAFSRVYLGAHYPGDVLSGGLAGAGLAQTYRGVLKYLFGK